MKTLLILFFVLIGAQAWSDENASNDFVQSNTEVKPLSSDDLAYRLYIKGEIFVLNQEGDKLVNMANENREWQFDGPSAKLLESNWL
ncbi:MAG: hypothetical protein ACAH59_06300, partial [Pseudobdellovibrionaceae bacterium]